MFTYTERAGPVEVAFTDRHGGVSGGPYASLDLGDRPELDENLARVIAALAAEHGGIPTVPVLMRQVHGAEVHVLGAAEVVDLVAGLGSGPPHLPTADGVVTDQRTVALVVRAADCVPVLLADVDKGIVGAAHAGRPGMVAGVVPQTVRAMRGLGAEELVAWVGPHVCGACYEVPELMRSEVAEAVPEAFAETSWGTPALDIGAGVTAQLRADGVDVVDVSRCTREDENLFSYRRQGAESGRLAGLVRVRP